VGARTCLAAVAATALVGGCGGGNSTQTHTPARTTVAGPPKPKEPLKAAAKRLERALPGGDCRTLAPLMLHSVRRGVNVSPSKPPVKVECDFIRKEQAGDLKGFRVSKVRQFGPSGVVDGRGAGRGPNEVVGSIWALDVDGSWRLVFDAILRPQVGVPPQLPHAAASANRFVRAIGTRDCDTFWRLLNVGARFVRAANGQRARFCKNIAATYKQKAGGIADIATDPSAKPRELGATGDIALYGLSLKSGRYLVFALTGRIGGIADAEQKDHEHPSVLEIVSVRLPP
jgi:hypothetical protein